MHSTNRPVILIPLDSRPCCRQFPERLLAICGRQLISPPLAYLGDLTHQGDCAAIHDWLKENHTNDALSVVALDMVTFGGLIPSRAQPDTDGTTFGVKYLRCVMRILENAPLLAFITVMRVAPTQYSLADVLQAERIIAFSSHMYEQLRESQSPSAISRNTGLQDDMRSIGVKVIGRYLANRRTKHTVNGLVLAFFPPLEPDTPEPNTPKPDGERFLLFCLDDSRVTGINIFEADQIRQAIQSNDTRAAVCTGTDEIAMLLLARALAPDTPVSLHWSSHYAARSQTRYEDRPLGEVASSQAAAARIILQSDSNRQVWVYAQTNLQEQFEASSQPHTAQSDALTNACRARLSPSSADSLPQHASPSMDNTNLPEFLDALRQALDNGAQVTVADTAWANGADNMLAEALISTGLWSRLTGYFAWNTAGNTLGSALALAALAPETPSPETECARLTYLLERLADDYLYQTIYRQPLSAHRGGSFLPLSDEDAAADAQTLTELIGEQLQNICRQSPIPFQLSRFTARLPWNRLFEIEAQVSLSIT